MATAYGNQVQRWRAKVVASVVSTTDTTARVRVQAYWCSVAWGYSVYNSRGGACIGGACTYATFTASSATGETREILVATREQTFNRGDAASSVACKATVTLSGGYHDGTSTASVSVTIPAIAYHVPSPPTGASASRASDSQAKVSWTNHPSGTTGKYTGLAIERQTDGGSWVQLATLGATVANYTDNGLSANHRYRWRVRAKNNAGWSTYATTGYVYTTPAAPTAVTLSKTDETTVAVSITGAAPWATSYEVQWRLDGGAWQAAGTTTSWPFSHSPGGGTARYRVRAKRGSLASAWRESGDITTMTPPLAPTVTLARDVWPQGEPVAVSWARSHPDGSAQSSAQVEVTGPDGSPVTHDVAGAASSLALEGLADGAYSVRVRTHGLDPDWGAWSGPVPFTVATPPQVVITDPAIDGDVVAVVPFEATWEVTDATGVSSQSMTLSDGVTGQVLHTAALAPDARSYGFSAETYLPANMGAYVLRIDVTGGSSLASSAERAFGADYAEPATPWAEVTYDYDTMSATVEVRHGDPGWRLEGTTLVSPEDNARPEGVPITAGAAETDVPGILELGDVSATSSVSVVRMLADGTQWLVEEGMASGAFARDPLPPLNVAYTYLVTAYSDVGTATTLEVPARVDAPGIYALNFGRAAATCELLWWDAEMDEGHEVAGTAYHFADGGAGGGLPLFYGGTDLDVTRDLSATTLDDAQALRLRALARTEPCAWVRDPLGCRSYDRVTIDLSRSASDWGHEVSVSCEELRFEEAWDG